MRDDATAPLISPPPGGHLLSLKHKQVIFQCQKCKKINKNKSVFRKGHLVWEVVPDAEYGCCNLLLSLILFWILVLLCYYHRYLVIADGNFSGVMLSRWSAVRLVPEWQLIIRFDEETHVPVMSGPTWLRVTNTLFNKSSAPVAPANHAIWGSSHFSVKNYSTKRCWE